MDFKELKMAFEHHFDEMATENKRLYVTNVDKDAMWELYLNSIPAEDNKIFRKRIEYDCSCCRGFIKRIGNVVAINEDNSIESVWDIVTPDEKWNVVADEMSKFVKAAPITDVFISKERRVGTDYNWDNDEDIKWEHFSVVIPEKHMFIKTQRYSINDTLFSLLGDFRDNKNVLKRALDEFKLSDVDTVLELINQGSLYRGDEYKERIVKLREIKKEYDKLPEDKKEIYTWRTVAKIDPAIAKIRNTAIGTLLIDISEDVDLEEAVRKYEVVTAPANYKRSKPIFTKKMLENAQKTITELGYIDSLERRYANADDITVNNILFSNKDTAKRIQGASSLFDELAKETSGAAKKFDRVEEVAIDKFIEDVLPTVSEVEAYVENKHTPNFMSLIAPVHNDSKTMFKWNNNFSWAYAGNVTDSIMKQNVKNAGGNINGVLRFSIQWNDLGEFDGNDNDAHCIEPNKNEISFSKKINHLTGGNLDVDIIHPIRNKAAVENITWPSLNKMLEGTYEFFVHCYSGRGGRSGFRAEIEFDGQIHSFDYNKPLRDGQKIVVAKVTLKNGQFTISEQLPSNVSSKEVWNIKTNEFVPVSVICYSPNYWDEQNGIGNKHYFFMLKDCVNPELPNGWYNEFLNGELYPAHRKVLEALSSKAHVQETEDQLSGLGFSSTLRNELVVKVKGTTERVLKIKF